MKKLCILHEDGKIEELQGFIHSPMLSAVKRTKIPLAFQKYINVCTSKKCIKNQNSEKLYFKKLESFLTLKEIEYIDEVTRDHMDEFESILLSKTKSSSVNRRFNTFKNFFVKCFEWKIIVENPCFGKKKLKESAKVKKPWTKSVFDKFIVSCDEEHKAFFSFLWLTGCRPVEAKNLKWSDIDYDNKCLNLSCGKNAQTNRSFPLSKDLDRLLHNLKIKSSFVFLVGGKSPDSDLIYHYAKDRLRPLGLGDYTVYGIRHGFGTKLANEGVSAFYIAELMGHSKLDTTKRYTHSEKNRLISILDNNN